MWFDVAWFGSWFVLVKFGFVLFDTQYFWLDLPDSFFFQIRTSSGIKSFTSAWGTTGVGAT